MNKVQDTVANGVATVQDKWEYVRPQIEVVNLDEQPKLLSASRNGGWSDGPTSGGDLED